ncbi:hypothetical protein B5S29_g2877 [[Candida] boidinii]|nr:hypothetical protein B5S29_g2877 [[Candida] boidinii]
MSDKINRNTTTSSSSMNTNGNMDIKNSSGGRSGGRSGSDLSNSPENMNANSNMDTNNININNSNNNNNSSLMKINPICTVTVTKFFNSDNNSRLLNLVVDDIVHVLSKSTTGWWDGIIIDPNGSVTRGWFPHTYTKIISPKPIDQDDNNNSNNNIPSFSSNSPTPPPVNSNIKSRSAPPLQTDEQMAASTSSDLSNDTGISETDKLSINIQRQASDSNSISQSIHSRPLTERTKSNTSKPLSQSNSIYSMGNNNNNNSSGSGNHLDPVDAENNVRSNSNQYSHSHSFGHASSIHQMQQYQQQQQHQATNHHFPSTSSSVQISRPEEIEALFDPDFVSTPTMNYIPVWIPKLTEDDSFLYYNTNLNIYSRELPFITTPILDENSHLDIPTANQLNNIDTVPINLKTRQTDEDFKASLANNTNNNTNNFGSGNNSGSGIMGGNGSFANNLNPDMIDSFSHSDYGFRDTLVDGLKKGDSLLLYNPKLFYYESDDIHTWEQLQKFVQTSLLSLLDSLSKNSKSLFLAHLNNISKSITSLQTSSQRLSNEIELQKLNIIVQKLLKGMTASLIQLTINGNLHLVSDKNSPHYMGSLAENDDFDGDDEYDDDNESRIGGVNDQTSVDLEIDSDPEEIENDNKLTVPSSTLDTTNHSNQQVQPINSNFANFSFTANEFRRKSVDRGRKLRKSKDNLRSTTPSSLHSNTGSEIYIRQAEKDAAKLGKRVNTICKLFSNLRLSTGENPHYVPLTQPRFFRGKFNGGNWNNPIFGTEYGELADIFINKKSSKQKLNLLLDDEVIQNLKKRQTEVNRVLNDVSSILDTSASNNVQVDVFLEERNLKILTLIYHSLPFSQKFLNIVESIDLTIFTMISKLAESTSLNSLMDEESVNLESSKNSLVANPSPSDQSDPSTRASVSMTDKERFEEYQINNSRSGTLKMDDPFDESANSLRQLSTITTNTIITNPTSEEMNNNNNNNNNNSTTNKNSDAGSSGNNTNSNNDNTNTFYEATDKLVRPALNEFVNIKQELHSSIVEVIQDTQCLSLEDPESFIAMKDRDVLEPGAQNFGTATAQKTNNNACPINEYAKKLVDNMEEEKIKRFREKIYLYDANYKLKDSMENLKKNFDMIICSIEQLKEHRQNILNYCSRLMNTDFTIASLFIAERHNTLASALTSTEYYYENDNKRGSYSSTNDTPWFLDIDDDEKSLIYDSNGLKGGNKKGLISKFVNPVNVDELFYRSFLLMFKTIMTPEELFSHLIEKYHTSMPEALTYEEYGIWLESKLRPMQQHILNSFEKLFKEYWNVNYNSNDLIEIWGQFTSNNVSIPKSLKDLGFKVMECETQQEIYDNFGTGNPKTIKPSQKAPPPLFSDVIFKKGIVSIREVDITEVARQITLLQFELYSKINKFELLHRAWSPRKYGPIGQSKSISAFIQQCNTLTHFTSYLILTKTDYRRRADMIKYFIVLAEKFVRIKNFSSMTAIISALGSTQISRLKKTWELIPQHVLANFNRMDSLMSIGKNYSEYRNMLKFIDSNSEPCLPFFGVYLSDLRFMSDGNADYLHKDRRLINMNKKMMITSTIEDALKYLISPYNFEKIDEIQNYLQEHFKDLPNEEKMYEMSIKLEARVTVANTVNDEKTHSSSHGPFHRTKFLGSSKH